MNVSIKFSKEPRSKRILSGILPSSVVEDNKLSLKQKREKKLRFFLPIIDSIEMLMENFDLIESTPVLYNIQLYDSWISSAYIGKPSPEFVLGELLTLWRNGSWTTVCKKCGNKIYITNTAGSPLSGAGSAWGICSGCRACVFDIKPFSRFFLSAIHSETTVSCEVNKVEY